MTSSGSSAPPGRRPLPGCPAVSGRGADVPGRLVMTRLAGTGLVAGDLWLLAHDDVTGRPFLQRRALGLGLAGALLAELVIGGHLAVRAGEFRIVSAVPPGDGLAAHVLGVLAGERERHPVADWLTFLAVTAPGQVALRLARAGYLTRAVSRRPWRDGRWVPADPDAAFAPVIRVAAVLAPARRGTAADVTLAGLAVACGLGSRLLPYGPAGSRGRLDAAVRQLHPDLGEVISQVQAAVDSALLAHRV
jgi:hypothetical protein